MTTINWLHLSDWHQRTSDFDRRAVREALLKNIRERIKIDPGASAAQQRGTINGSWF